MPKPAACMARMDDGQEEPDTDAQNRFQTGIEIASLKSAPGTRPYYSINWCYPFSYSLGFGSKSFSHR